MISAAVLAAVALSAPIEVARGEAVRGEWKANESDFRYVDDATVDLASNGDAVVAWVDQGKRDLFVQRYSAKGEKRFTEAINVSRNGATFSWLPRVVVQGDDIAILWQEIIFSGGTHGGEILFARSIDGGKTFTAPINLSNSIAGDGKGTTSEKVWHNGSLALARRGNELLATWTEYEGALWVRRSTDNGKTFAPAVRVAGAARAPSIVLGEKGRAHVVWTSGLGIHHATSDDSGKTFSAPRMLYPSDNIARLAVDEKGAVHLVYGDKGTIFYARDFGTPRAIAGSSNAYYPSIAVDGGAVHLAWDQYAGQNAYPTGLMVTTSRDGKTFEAPQPVFTAPSKSFYGSQQGLSIKLAARGDLVFVNSTFRRDDASWITLLRKSR